MSISKVGLRLKHSVSSLKPRNAPKPGFSGSPALEAKTKEMINDRSAIGMMTLVDKKEAVETTVALVNREAEQGVKPVLLFE